MNGHLDDRYFRWLYSQVCSLRENRPSRTYRSLLKILYKKEFLYLVPNDDNRAEDGRDLRYEYLDRRNIENADPYWLESVCSMLEMLIGISRRLAFQADGETRDWFWCLIENIDHELLEYRDDTVIPLGEIDEILDRVIWRLYARDGRGGLFPLQYVGEEEDLAETELWSQLSAYLRERIVA